MLTIITDQLTENEICSHGILYLCLDIDECAIKTNNCSLHAICDNTEGSFNCSCKDGFSGDGINCTGNYELLIHLFLSTCCLLNDNEIDNDKEVFCARVQIRPQLTTVHYLCLFRYRRVCHQNTQLQPSCNL